MINDKSQQWTMYTLWGDVSYARGMETMWDGGQPVPAMHGLLHSFLFLLHPLEWPGAEPGRSADFGDTMEALGANVPWMLTNGNHERCARLLLAQHAAGCVLAT